MDSSANLTPTVCTLTNTSGTFVTPGSRMFDTFDEAHGWLLNSHPAGEAQRYPINDMVMTTNANCSPSAINYDAANLQQFNFPNPSLNFSSHLAPPISLSSSRTHMPPSHLAASVAATAVQTSTGNFFAPTYSTSSCNIQTTSTGLCNNSEAIYANRQHFFQPLTSTRVTSQPIRNNVMQSATNCDHIYSNGLQQTSVHLNQLSTAQIASRSVMTKDLPTFTGKAEDWPIFITNYEQSTERCGFSSEENLIRLQKALKGPALNAVRGKLMMPTTVPYAIETLRMLFGRPEVIHHKLQQQLREYPAVKEGNLEALIGLALAVQNYRATIQATGLGAYLNDPVLLNELLNKIPCNLRLEWGRYKLSHAETNICNFDNWLFSLASCASQVTSFGSSMTAAYDEEKRGTHQKNKERIFIHNVMEEGKSSASRGALCQICEKDHHLADCKKFQSMKQNERWALVRDNKLCIRCFGKHYIRQCKSKRKCGVDGCTYSHHMLLHSNNYGRKIQASKTIDSDFAENKRNGNQASSLLFHGQQKAVFRYVPVRLYGKNSEILTWALIDEGAGCTIIEDAIADELGLDGPINELCLRWTGDVVKNEINSKHVSLAISARQSNANKHNLTNVRTVSCLDLPEQSLDISSIKSRKHLRDLPIISYQKVKARILIGLDNAKIGAPLEIRDASGDDLIAARCKLGWGVYGRKEDSVGEQHRILHICSCNKDDQMDELLRNFFSVEAIGINKPATALISKVDEKAWAIMKSTTKFLKKERRWETGLLWRHQNIDLPDSFGMAMRRLLCLEQKMSRDPVLKEFVVEKIKDYEKQGYIRKLKKSEISTGGKSWYIPIFSILNVNKNKRRLVWDAAATVNNTSLNTVLMKGPDLLKSLVGVLVRFREKPVAICGDIKEMFHQVRIIEEDQVAQKFLWRGGETNRPVETFIMRVMTFGASCSPSLANYVKNKNAERFYQSHKNAVKAIIDNTFVDDWLQSCNTEGELLDLAEKVRMIHHEGGFEMRNWLSNSKSVLQSLSAQPTSQEKFFEEPDCQYEKVLGMWWIPQADVLTFSQHFDDQLFDMSKVPTKRQILRTTMKIFDPLGILGFYIVYAKMILQDIWRSKVGWDDPIKSDEHDKWKAWLKCLPSISQVRLPRCYPLANCSQNLQLHVFVDASATAYAAVAYLRAEYGGKIQCSLLASKTRVSPLKPISIPRLELMAAILGLRLSKFVSEELSLKISSRTFWSDSKNVLFWINSDARKYQHFVAYRIGEILEESKISEWRWVPTRENVADEGTKWLKTPNFESNSRWFCGPQFLYEDETLWPKTDLYKNDSGIEILHHVEMKRKLEFSFKELCVDVQSFSQWEKLRRSQWFVLKFLKQTFKKSANSDIFKMMENLNSVIDAEIFLFRACQEEFADEIAALKSDNGNVHRKSPIYKLSPYLDEYGVIRMNGRIDAANNISYDMKRPIILPRHHSITSLIIDFYHRKFHHHLNEVVVNEMRQKFFIYGLRSLVRSTARKCQRCQNHRAAPIAPEMGPLPFERTASFTRPFSFTGVDYFGPIEVAVGRRREKRWGVLFTCLTLRAVHLELASSLSTDCFLLILKQFIARRGTPIRIWSDNATNFRGASRILMNEIENIATEEIERKHPQIEWAFIPPGSPHMGGAWERLVRSVKSILMDIVPKTSIREDVLRAAFADIEFILNSRPLTYVPLESPDCEALTPNHFILGTSNGIREKSSESVDGDGLRKNFKLASQIADQFWRRWIREYLPCITRRSKWFEKPQKPIAVGDVVLIVEEANKRGSWPKGIIVDVHVSKDGQIRSAVVKTTKGLLTRPVVKLAKLDVKG